MTSYSSSATKTPPLRESPRARKVRAEFQGERQKYRPVLLLEGICGSCVAVGGDDGKHVFAKTYDTCDEEFALNCYEVERALIPRMASAGLTPELLDVGKNEQLIVQPLIHGEDLGKILSDDGRFDSDKTRTTLLGILRAGKCMHDSGVIHRDLKPKNIMIPNKNGKPDYHNPVVVDFGLSRDKNGTDEIGHSAGSPTYQAPEQLNHSASDEQSDVYALGVVAYELLNGSTPAHYRNLRNSEELLYTKVRGPLVIGDASVDKRLRSVIAKATEPNRKKRFHNLAEMQEALAPKGFLRKVADYFSRGC